MAITFEIEKAEIFKIARAEKNYNQFLWKILRASIWFLMGLSIILWLVSFFKIFEISQAFLGLALILISIGLFVFLVHSYYLFYFKFIPKRLSENVLEGQNVNLAEYLSLESTKAILDSLKMNNLLYGLLKNPRIQYILVRAGINLSQYSENNPPSLTAVLEEAAKFAILEKNQQIEIGDLFYGYCLQSEFFKKICLDLDLKPEDLANIIYWEKNDWQEIENQKKFISEDFWEGTGGIGREWAYGYIPHLKLLSYDLSEAIRRIGLGLHIIGHRREIEEMERILTRSSKNNILLIGEPGIGKKTIVLGFTQNIQKGRVARELRSKRVLQIDLGRLLSGDPAEVEAKILTALNEAVSAGNIILFLEDIHNLFGGEATKIGAIDASEIVLPYLQSANLQLIGTTTFGEYHKYIEPNSAVASNFEKIEVSEPTENETIRILEDAVPMIEGRYKVVVTYEALKEIVKLAKRYIFNRPFPEKAIDLLDEVGVYVGSKTNDKIISPKHIQVLISEKTKIPTGEIKETEKEKLLNLEAFLHQRVIDQDEAIKAIAEAMRRARTGLKKENKPIGSFLFLGPTGVGKTETARALAENYFGSENAMSRLDMSEYKTPQSIDRLIGSPDGSEGVLTSQIKENPFCLLLLDEIEKAHPDILNLFLAILDEGRMTDRFGRKVDFSNTIIIATSNAGAELIRQAIKSGESQEILREKLLEYLQSQVIFKPEFLNRFDGVISFKPLGPNEIYQIAQLLISKLVKRMQEEKEIFLRVTPEAIQKLAQLGYNPQMGARPMQRVITDKVENWLAEKLLRGEIQKGQTVEFRHTDIS